MFTYKTKDNYDDFHYVREEIFMKEQGYQNEFDEIDEYCYEITFYEDGKLVGCGRYFEEEGYYTIGRIAVLQEYRKKGYASKFVTTIEEEVKKLGGTKTRLHAQLRVKELYDKLGYVQCSDIEYDEGVEHIWMRKEL